jgi:hypothetical protein
MTVRAHENNLQRLDRVATCLGEINDEVVYLGGCVAGLLVAEAFAPQVRPTKDVDLIIELVSRTEFYELEQKLLELGFGRPAGDDHPICRWVVKDILVDVMPIDPAILGFSNQWYPLTFQTATAFELPSGRSIHIITAPAFVATKLAAFEDRGEQDYLSSHDLEDLLFVLDGRDAIEQEIKGADPALRQFLAIEISQLLADDRFVEALAGHLSPDPASQARLPNLIERLKRIAGKSASAKET